MHLPTQLPPPHSAPMFLVLITPRIIVVYLLQLIIKIDTLLTIVPSLRFIVCVASVLDTCALTCIHHYTQNNLTTLKIL